MTESEREVRDQETHDAVIEMRALIMGVNGRGGLVDDVKEVKLSVQEMKLKTEKGDVNVANVLQKTQKVFDDLYDNKNIPGLMSRVGAMEKFCRDNRKLILWFGGINLTVIGGVVWVMMAHLGLR